MAVGVSVVHGLSDALGLVRSDVLSVCAAGMGGARDRARVPDGPPAALMRR